jgi:hypothetical protein
MFYKTKITDENENDEKNEKENEERENEGNEDEPKVNGLRPSPKAIRMAESHPYIIVHFRSHNKSFFFRENFYLFDSENENRSESFYK